MPKHYDVIVVGAGIIGSMVARCLSRYDLKILLIEKESDICTGATAANSALIHGGYDALPGSLKAEMNVKGNAAWEQLSQELQFPFERRGTYVVAIGAEERPRLDELAARAEVNGVPVELISGAEMLKREPLINPEVSGALYAPTGGICDPWAVTIAAAENAVLNGVELRLDTEFEDFIWEGEEARRRESEKARRRESEKARRRESEKARRRIVGIQTNRGAFSCRWVINAAGLFADEVMHKAGVRPEFKITARRGEYY
ncbi:MAG: FAD-dependent oxidoreductase, partial [Chloroflexota bacterium]|nr:FAD-dependent oxidoreductase [Chloroflexota bacterium]